MSPGAAAEMKSTLEEFGVGTHGKGTGRNVTCVAGAEARGPHPVRAPQSVRNGRFYGSQIVPLVPGSRSAGVSAKRW